MCVCNLLPYFCLSLWACLTPVLEASSVCDWFVECVLFFFTTWQEQDDVTTALMSENTEPEGKMFETRLAAHAPLKVGLMCKRFYEFPSSISVMVNASCNDNAWRCV